MARIVFLSNKSTLIISLYVILLFFVFERKLDPRERLRRYLGLELTAANATLNNDVCEITFDLEHCSCQRTIQSLLPNGCPGFYASTKGILQRIKDEYGESTCGDWATLRGPHQNVISYSAFGDFPNEYFNGMVEIMPQLPKAYPGWYTRFYHRMNMQNPIHRNWLCSLACKYPFLDLCDAEKLPEITVEYGNREHDSPCRLLVQEIRRSCETLPNAESELDLHRGKDLHKRRQSALQDKYTVPQGMPPERSSRLAVLLSLGKRFKSKIGRDKSNPSLLLNVSYCEKVVARCLHYVN
ncbi:uncharacterized protein LOC135204299 isoform X2 [Macrobrachium nipponense]|uniref:uncharacterized protein LOC135204299 isoform X2 n=1 Tax=Macrobrachium nipponense TaxID=159736 RepID=UPI0030C82E27